MKKTIIIILSMMLLVGCSKDNKENESKLYNSLEKAYVSVYATDGVGLAVYGDEKTELNGKTWYLVATSKYNSMSKLSELVESVYNEDLVQSIEKNMTEKYKEIDGKLYTTSMNGCLLKYQLTDNLQEEIKKDIKDIKYRGKKVTFKINNKKYTGKLDGDYYKFDEKIFDCEIELESKENK